MEANPDWTAKVLNKEGAREPAWLFQGLNAV